MTNATIGTPTGPEGTPAPPNRVSEAQATEAQTPRKSQSWPARHKFLTALGALVLAGGIATATQGGGSDMSTPLENEAVPTVENEATGLSVLVCRVLGS